MPDHGSAVRRRLYGEFSEVELTNWIDEVLEANAEKTAIGIAVSNNVFSKLGQPDNYNGIRVAADPDLYPDDTIEVRFE